MRAQHSNLSFKCNRYHCSKLVFATADLLAKHHEKKHLKIPCQKCGRMIKPNNMESHIRQSHEMDRRAFMCEVCGEILNSYDMHKYHKESMHEPKEQLQCDICKRWFVWTFLHFE